MRALTSALPPTPWAASPAPVPWLWLVSPGQGPRGSDAGGGTGPDGVQGLTGAPLLIPGTPGKLAPPEVPPDLPGHSTCALKPGDSKAPCTYTLERRVDARGTGRLVRGGAGGWRSWGDKYLPELLTVMALGAWATLWPQPLPHAACRGVFLAPRELGIPTATTTHPPTSHMTVRFRVACANRAGQGPFSNPSEKVRQGRKVSGDRAGARGGQGH